MKAAIEITLFGFKNLSLTAEDLEKKQLSYQLTATRCPQPCHTPLLSWQMFTSDLQLQANQILVILSSGT